MLDDKKRCTGCTACCFSCAVNAIKMKDDEAGFWYPVIDDQKCVECHKCESICPVLNPINIKENRQIGYILQNKNSEKLYESTSGAVFPEIAEYVINLRGNVYGAAFTDEFRVEHISVEDLDDLKRLKKSKYVQSNIGDTFLRVKSDLLRNRYVCFSGTPCQVEGLLAFLGQDYSKLITVDVVCHGVSSPLLWQKYLGYKQRRHIISDICFRDKSKGYQYNQMSILYNDGSRYSQGTEYDQMLRAFFSNICDRESCYNCNFKKINRVSDFTIWDSFNNKEFDVGFDENVGTSKMIINTEKGKKVFEEIKKNFFYKEIDVGRLVDSSYEMTHSVSRNAKREEFITDLNNCQTEELFDKYFRINGKVMISKVIRELLYKLKLYTFVRKMSYRIKGYMKHQGD